MDGLYNFTVQEPIFREYLQEFKDENNRERSNGGRAFASFLAFRFFCRQTVLQRGEVDGF